MNGIERNVRVLVVDDQPISVKLMADYLTAAGYEVLTASHGEDALKIVRQSTPDIILLDVLMPGMDGFQVTERLKKDPCTCGIPIVLVTTLDGADHRVKGFNGGVDDFLTKPVDHMELLARVRSLVKLKKLQDEMAKETALPSLNPLREVDKRVQKNRVLIVEDDESTADAYKAILEDAGCDSLVAYNGKEADALLLHEPMPDLILLDLMLPDTSGIDLLGKWRANHEMQDIPIIMLSVVSERETKVKGIETGADDYLVKPVDPVELIARVKSLFHKYEMQQKLRIATDRLFIQSTTDMLTDLYNRRYLKSVLDREIAIFTRYSLVFSVMMLDIDNFKDINDIYGHPVGDNILKTISKIIKEQTRKSDVVTRYGGDEFVILLSNTTTQECMEVAENMRIFIENCRIPDIGDRQVTVSIGTAECRTDDDINRIIQRADDALYKAKREGRNRTRGS